MKVIRVEVFNDNDELVETLSLCGNTSFNALESLMDGLGYRVEIIEED